MIEKDARPTGVARLAELQPIWRAIAAASNGLGDLFLPVGIPRPPAFMAPPLPHGQDLAHASLTTDTS